MSIDTDEDEFHHHNVYVGGKVHIRQRRCDTCIFGGNSPVSTARRDSMVALCAQGEGVIPCHHHLGEAIEPVCHGFYELRQNFVLRLADAFEVIEWVS